jgi:arginine decarboxylase
VGAWRETLGDLHNLYGVTNVVSVKDSVKDSEEGGFEFARKFRSDSIFGVLSYVEYPPRTSWSNFVPPLRKRYCRAGFQPLCQNQW